MDPIALMFLTVATNALVTGVIIFLFQRRIERSYSQRMFEDQLKFSKAYPKSLEVLETYRQKLINCATLTSGFNIDIASLLFLDDELDEEKFNNERQKLYDAFSDLTLYLQQNRIHIPERFVAEVESINTKGTVLCSPSFEIKYTKNDRETHRIEYLYHMILVTNLSLEKMDEGESDARSAYLLIQKMANEYQKLSSRLEEIYESVANTAGE